MSELFDNLSRILATPRSRRQTMYLIGSVVTTVALDSLSKRAWGDTTCDPGEEVCGGKCYSPHYGLCCNNQLSLYALYDSAITYKCCYNDDGTPYGAQPDYTCCGSGTECEPYRPICCKTPGGIGPIGCCLPTQVCARTSEQELYYCYDNCPPDQVQCGNYCCESGQICDSTTSTCVATSTLKCLSGQVECGKICCPSGQTCNSVTNTCVPVNTPITDCSNKLVAAVPHSIQQSASSSIPLILATAQQAGITDPAQLAYILATAQTESQLGAQMTEKASGKKYEYNKGLGNTNTGDGPKFKGRGYAQITGRLLYTYWSERLKVDMVNHPELATQPDIAAQILVEGMRDGVFTGLTPKATLVKNSKNKLSDYIINCNTANFFSARKIVNPGELKKNPSKVNATANNAAKYFNIIQMCHLSGVISCGPIA